MRRGFCLAFVCTLLAVLGGAPSSAKGPAVAKDKLHLLFTETFGQNAVRWEPTDPKAWRVDKLDGKEVYHQFQNSKYAPPHRSPLNRSLVKDVVVTNFELTVKAKSTGKDGPHRDMCLFFGYQDPAHFYYVHIAKQADDHANQIFIVNKSDRKKISTKSTTGTPWDDAWHNLKVSRDVEKGSIEVFFDDMKTPIMTANDKTFTWGQVGVGSFDDSGYWMDIELKGHRYEKE